MMRLKMNRNRILDIIIRLESGDLSSNVNIVKFAEILKDINLENGFYQCSFFVTTSLQYTQYFAKKDLEKD
jgi:hypothetical protein